MAAPTIVNQTPFAWSSGNTVPVTIPAPTNGNAVVVLYSGPSTTPVVNSISLSGVTFAQSGSGSAVNRYASIWRAYNVSGAGTALVINLSGTPASGFGVVLELAGLGAGTDNSATASNGNSTAVDSATITPTSGKVAAVVAVCRAGGVISAGPSSGTNLTQTSTRTGCAVILIASTTGTYQIGWTAGTGTYDVMIVALLGPNASSGPSAESMYRHRRRMRGI